MDNIWGFWWLIFPLSGIIGGWIKGAQKWDEKRRKDKLELARIQYGQAGQQAVPPPPPAAASPSTGEIDRLLAEHTETERRWLDYELDVAKLIDFPVMTDMREPVTVDFHRAKQEVDRLRPEDPTELRNPELLERYREAVREFTLTFEIAEREARRRRATDFSPEERQSLERAKKLLALAEDSAATQAERQSAYKRATRELQGLIVLPQPTTDALEQRIAGALGSAPRQPES
ncbi:DUF2786 domain-containing protein [Ruania zhangjianzhongii]|uniref:DUF2786 domain-containing protein n=1 Tax=Ruania zhangjianzhongii TaxID=2603206 RepID=UPI0011CB3276|nr:DUF2786 domain-containing protein [Ruania zhangjianzhongii]